MGFFSKLVENINKPIFYLDKSGNLEFANRFFLEYLQLDALPKKNLSSILGLDERTFKNLLGRAIKTKKDQIIEFDLPNESSERDPLKVILFPESNNHQIMGFSGELKELELDSYTKLPSDLELSEISELEKKYNTLYNLTFEGMIIHDAGIVVDANPAFCRISGFSYDEIIGSNIIELCVLPEYYEKVFNAMKRDSTLPYEVRSRRKDGTIFYNEVESRKIIIGNRSLRVTAIRDIDARKRAELELRESEERYRLLSNITFEGVFIHRNGVVLDANQSLAKMIGYDLDEIIGKNIIQLVVLPEYHKRVIQALKNEETSPYDVKVKRKDGSEFFTEIEAGMVYYHGEYVRVTAARDISWRKEAEEEIKLHNEELKKTNQELDNFVYRVSHDLKAPIASTKGLIHIARIEKDEERISECLELIEKSMNKLDSFILDILDYSRNSRLTIEPEIINFDEFIEDALLNLKFLQTENKVRIEKKLAQTVNFYSDKRRLIFIFNNLISNAIRFCDHEKTDSYLIIHLEQTKKNAVISFIDNGIGIEQEHQEHIFGMFYRANETRVGSGLGLYIVKEAVDKLNGVIEVESKAKKGTTFKVTLPNLSI